MSRRDGTRRAAARAVLAVVLTVLAGCASLPTSGPVESRPTQAQTGAATAADFQPAGPVRGGSPTEIVEGFLQAMLATPLRTDIARQFLTSQGSRAWAPEKGTVIYQGSTLAGQGAHVVLRLNNTARLDGRGEWLGQDRTPVTRYALDLVREKGQWRISNPPDVLAVPQPHFETRYAQYFLYFFDKSGQVLVPEPVYLPSGQQASTLLVRGLLRGVDQGLLGTERTYIPAHTELDLSVPVSPEGTAEVPLSDDILDLSGDALQLALAQLAWTLRQVPGLERMRITVDGSPLDLPGESADQPVSAWSEYDPAVNWASQELFGIRQGRVVTVLGDEERRVSGPFGVQDHALRSVAVDLSAEQVAGVTADGHDVLVGPCSRPPGQAPSTPSTGVSPWYTGGADVLRPAWDLYGQLWLLDRRGGSATLSVVRDHAATSYDVPGLTGRDVTAFVMSRDGTRLVALLAGADGRADRLVVSRVMRDQAGRVRGLTPAEPLPVGALRVDEIRDVAWRTPGSVVLLTGPTPGRSQVVVARIDGSSAFGDFATNTEVFRDDAVRVVTSPAAAAPLYVGTTTGTLYELAPNGRWTGTGVEPGLISPTFVG